METLRRDMEKVMNMTEEEMEKLQQPACRHVKNARAILRTPADIYEHPSYYSFVLDMPGLELSNIKVKVENGILHVAGKKKKSKAGQSVAGNEGVKVIRMERRRARYMRKFTLPENSNPEDVKAVYKDGVLTVTVAKMKPEESSNKPKTITIPVT